MWSHLGNVEQIVGQVGEQQGQVGEQQGPVWEGLLRQIVEAQKVVPVSIGPELLWAWEEGKAVIDPSWRQPYGCGPKLEGKARSSG